MNLYNRSAMSSHWGFLLLASLLFCCGCQDRNKPAPPEEPTIPKESSVVDAEGLPELDDYLGSKLDGDRLQVPSPAGWYIRPRSSKCVKRFHPTRELMYPSIIVTASDYKGLEEVSPENVDEFARRIAGAIIAEGLEEKLVLAVAPIKVGNVSGACYRRRGKREGKIIERLFIETVFAGRKYCYELRARTGTLSQYRPYLMAVVAGTKFLETEPDKQPEPPEKP